MIQLEQLCNKHQTKPGGFAEGAELKERINGLYPFIEISLYPTSCLLQEQ